MISARVSLPRLGVWHADLTLDTPKTVTGAVTINLNGFTLVGFSRRGGPFLDSSLVRVVGGKGGLATVIPSKGFVNVTRGQVLRDILQTVGESLSASSDAAVMGVQLPFWAQSRGHAGKAVKQAVDNQSGAVWRVLPDGTVWVGIEVWKGSALAAHDVLRADPLVDTVQLYADTPNVVPGTVLDGRRVSYVEHVIEEDSIRTGVWLE